MDAGSDASFSLDGRELGIFDSGRDLEFPPSLPSRFSALCFPIQHHQIAVQDDISTADQTEAFTISNHMTTCPRKQLPVLTQG